MKPDISRWKERSPYDFFDTLTVEGLAWECLRRHKPYQDAYRKLAREDRASEPLSDDLQQKWGLRFRSPTQPVRARAAYIMVARP